MRLLALIVAGALMSPAIALAQTAPVAVPAAPSPQACGAMDVELPPELVGWTDKADLNAAVAAADLAKAALIPGKAYLATLPSTSATTYVIPPEKPGAPTTHGGLFELTVPSAGAYVVALGAAAWIDVLKDGAPVKSASHRHGPDCTTLRKMVVFQLQPGRHVVQIAGSASAALPIMVARRP